MAEGFLRIPSLVEVVHQRREHVSVGGPPPMRLLEHRDRPEWLAPGGLRWRCAARRSRSSASPGPLLTHTEKAERMKGLGPCTWAQTSSRCSAGKTRASTRARRSCSPAPVAAIDGQHVELADIKSQPSRFYAVSVRNTPRRKRLILVRILVASRVMAYPA